MKQYTILLLIILLGCASNKNFHQMKFGGGGGFTGEIKTYQLNSDGKVQEMKNGKIEDLKKIDKQKTRKLFELANEIKTYQFNEPDNMYSFIEIDTKGASNKIVWGFGSVKVDKRAMELYNELMLLTTKNNSHEK